MAKNKTAVYVVSGILIAAAAYFVIRGISFGKEAKAKKKEIEEGEERRTPVQEVVDPIVGAAQKGGAAIGSAISGLFGGASATPKIVTTKSSGTNLRPDPSTIKNPLKTYKGGVKLTVNGSKDVGGFTWYSVTEGANKGWVRSDAVNVA